MMRAQRELQPSWSLCGDFYLTHLSSQTGFHIFSYPLRTYLTQLLRNRLTYDLTV